MTLQNFTVILDYISIFILLSPVIVLYKVVLFDMEPEEINPKLGISEEEIKQFSISEAKKEYNKFYGGE